MHRTTPHPRLDALFEGKRDRLDVLAGEDAYGEAVSAAEGLLEVADDLGVTGVEKLIAVGGRAKFEAVVSELRVATMLARLGFTVEVLADEAFGGGGVYTPDLLVARGEFEILVEVFHGSWGSPDVDGPLDRALKAGNLRYRIEYRLGNDLSVPGISWAERSRAEQTVYRVVEQLVEHLKSAPSPRKGYITIEGHRFDYRPVADSDGYAAGGVTAVHWLRDEEHSGKLVKELKRKAGKQPKLPPDRRSTPFVVAYDNRESELTAVMVLSALTGSRCSFAETRRADLQRRKREAPVRHPPHVMEALDGPWGDLLHAWHFGLDADVRITRYGALIEAPWAAQLSGVLVTHSVGFVQWLPNPFATAELREPRLLDLGLPLRGLEPQHPAWKSYP